MAMVCDFCSTSTAALPIHSCEADAAQLCLSCHTKLPSANNQVVNKDHSSGIGVMCHMCGPSHHVMTFQEHQGLPGASGCLAVEDFAAIWGLQMNHDHHTSTSTSHVGSPDIFDQFLDLQTIQTTHPLTSDQVLTEKKQGQLEVCDVDTDVPNEEYLAFLNLEELIGDEEDQDLILRTQKLLDDQGNDNDHKLDKTVDFPRQSCSVPVNGSSCSSPCSWVPCSTLSTGSNIASHGVKGGQVFDARANAVMRYKQKKHSRVYVRKIRYEKKKAMAETRKRVRGRFVKN